MPSIDRREVMQRAWLLFRMSMRRFTRPAFAGFLRQAWAEVRDAPVTPWAVLQRCIFVERGTPRAEVIRRAELALASAETRAALYRRVGAPRDAYQARNCSADIQRVGALQLILAAEKAAAGLTA